jgi:hypothetical protein
MLQRIVSYLLIAASFPGGSATPSQFRPPKAKEQCGTISRCDVNNANLLALPSRIAFRVDAMAKGGIVDYGVVEVRR